MKEGEMYRTVKNFLINKKSCSDQRTWFTYEDGAEDGKKLSLNLYGGEIEPDVYGVDEEKDIIYLAEGKKDYRGRSLDEAIIQGVSYQRFAHYVYLFFPKHIFEEEDAKDMLNHAKDLCKKNNLGLLFTEENENKEPKVEIEPKLSKFYGDEIYWKDFRKNAQETKGKIDKLLLMGGEKKVGNVHLPIIRDVCNLLGEEMEWKKEIFIHHLYERTLKIYRNKGKDGEISSLACYDWRYKNPLLRKLKGEREKAKEKAGEGEIKEKFEKIVEEAIKTLIYFGLCEREEGKIKLTPEGVNLKKTIEESDKDNLYTKNLSDSAIRIFISILLAKGETKEYISKMCEKMDEFEKQEEPQPRFSFWCNKCKFKSDWTLKKEYKVKFEDIYKEKKRICCPECGNEKVPQPYESLLFPFEGLDNYRLNILLEELKIIEGMTFNQISEKYRKYHEHLKKIGLDPPKKATKYWCLGENAPILNSTKFDMTRKG